MKTVDHSVLSNVGYLMGIAWKHKKFLFVIILIQMITGSLLPIMGLYLPVIAVELVLSGQEMGHFL